MVCRPVVRDAPAKVNLALHVVGRRTDGYHELESLVVFTCFGDRVSVAADISDSIAVSGSFAAGVPGDDGNLVARARDRLRYAVGGAACVSIAIEKNLPVASGVGGGSSDAAATLLALGELWQAKMPDEIFRIAGQLGADVPMCLAAQPLIARGIGHDIEPVAGFPTLAMVLVHPGVAISTPEIFRALASYENPPLSPLPPSRDFATTLSWLEESRNDMQATAMANAPQIGLALDALKHCGAAFVRMSGSGATCFGIFADDEAAARAAALIGRQQPSWLVVATRTMA